MSNTREVALEIVRGCRSYQNGNLVKFGDAVDAIDQALRQQEAEHQAALIRRDGFMCEAHPGLEFEHDPDCAGPGMPWVIEGREAILSALQHREQEVREACARVAETHSATDCDGPDCGVVIAAAIRKGE